MVHGTLLTNVPTATQDQHLLNASRVADSYIGSRYVLPLTGWGDDLRAAVCALAEYTIGGSKAFAADGGKTALRQRYDDAIAWLVKVRDGAVIPSGLADSSTSSHSAGMTVYSDPPRGW